MLNYLKGGPLDEHFMGNFDIFTKPLTDFLISAHKKGPEQFKLLDASQLARIVQYNSFSSMGPLLSPRVVLKQTEKNTQDEQKLRGQESFEADNVYLAPSFLNHSCEPNAHRSFFRDDSSIVFIKAIKDIAEGEEVTISYMDILANFEERQAGTAPWDF